MGSSTSRIKAGRVFVALGLTVLFLQPVVGCSWSKRMGSYLPVSSSAQRCEGRWFCFGGYETDGVPPERLAREEREARRAANSPMQEVSGPTGGMTPPAPPPAPGMIPEPGMPPQPGQALPVYKLPASEEEAKQMAPVAPGMPQPGDKGNTPAPVPGLKPYEQSGPDMKDLPTVPVIEQIKELGW